jgi:hypothetical protein
MQSSSRHQSLLLLLLMPMLLQLQLVRHPCTTIENAAISTSKNTSDQLGFVAKFGFFSALSSSSSHSHSRFHSHYHFHPGICAPVRPTPPHRTAPHRTAPHQLQSTLAIGLGVNSI